MDGADLNADRIHAPAALSAARILGVAAALPTAAYLLGLVGSSLWSRPGGYLMLAWPLATVGGVAWGASRLLDRLFRTRWPTPILFALAGAFVIACFTLQVALVAILPPRGFEAGSPPAHAEPR
ncbi:MAG: hypothetical protein JNM07_09835 [Phycisphaerae bacterium]|nr:hypothetical protein [Phycisphaerae bacterium]